MCSTPTLSLLYLSHPFEIEIVASQFSVRVVLMHDGHPMAYHLETFPKSKGNTPLMIESCMH